MADTTIIADLGDDNIFELDLSVAVDAVNDKIWFTAKNNFTEADVDAQVRLGLNVSGLSGIVVTNAASGIVQCQIPPASLPSVLAVEALIYDVQLKRTTDQKAITVKKGVMRLSKSVTQATV